MEQSKIDKTWEVFARLQRQFPYWPSTFSTCPRCGKHAARGSDVCHVCLTDELAKFIGPELATEAMLVLRRPAELWGEIRTKLKGEKE